MKPGERGAALLTVLLLVAVIAVIAAASLEKLRLSTRLSGNAAAVDQARAYAAAAEAIAASRIAALARAEAGRQPIPPAARTVAIPVPGGAATARLADGGNCFNLNSVVTGERFDLTQRPTGIGEFVGLMQSLGTPLEEARRVAVALADYIDSDIAPALGGVEDDQYLAGETPYRTANILLVDPSELRAVSGVNEPLYQLLRPWICTLPTSELSPVNINSLRPEQAPLLSMLAPERLSLDRARRLLAQRPPNGYQSADQFTSLPALGGVFANIETQGQLTVTTRWYALETVVALGGARFTQRTLIDARSQPARIVQRIPGGAD